MWELCGICVESVLEAYGEMGKVWEQCGNAGGRVWEELIMMWEECGKGMSDVGIVWNLCGKGV